MRELSAQPTEGETAPLKFSQTAFSTKNYQFAAILCKLHIVRFHNIFAGKVIKSHEIRRGVVTFAKSIAVETGGVYNDSVYFSGV